VRCLQKVYATIAKAIANFALSTSKAADDGGEPMKRTGDFTAGKFEVPVLRRSTFMRSGPSEVAKFSKCWRNSQDTVGGTVLKKKGIRRR
jgi:hypothetical protein